MDWIKFQTIRHNNQDEVKGESLKDQPQPWRIGASQATSIRQVDDQRAWTGRSSRMPQHWHWRWPPSCPGWDQIVSLQEVTSQSYLESWMFAWKCRQHKSRETPEARNHLRMMKHRLCSRPIKPSSYYLACFRRQSSEYRDRTQRIPNQWLINQKKNMYSAPCLLLLRHSNKPPLDINPKTLTLL